MEKALEIEQIKEEYKEIEEVLDERSKRRWCAVKARTYNKNHVRGGVTIVSKATGVSRPCIYRGIKEIEEGEKILGNRLRREGGGRKKNYRESNGDRISFE